MIDYDISPMIRRVLKTMPMIGSPVRYGYLDSNTFLRMVESYYDRAGVHTGIRSDRLFYYKKAENTVKCSIPLIKDDGTIDMISAFRCQHKTHKLPTKGGTRYADNVDASQIEALAFLTTLQCSVVNLPYGGAKGGLSLNPKNYTDRQLERLTRQYAIRMSKKRSIGASVDVWTPDVGTGAREMSWVQSTMHEYYGHQDINSEASTTGKYNILGGVQGKVEASGYGVYVTARTILNHQAWTKKHKIQPGLAGKTFITQGLGQIGYWSSRFMVEDGARLIGVAETDGSIYNREGLDVQKVKAYMDENGGVKGYPDAEFFPKDEVIYKNCDILIPAAVEMVIHSQNAHRFECDLVLQAASGPTACKGERICMAKGIQFIPDVLSNAGGVAVSYLEWLKNLGHVTPGRINRKWEEKTKENLLQVVAEATGLSYDRSKLLQGATEKDIVLSGVQQVMIEGSEQVLSIALSRKLDLRTAAYISAITKLDECYMLSGIPGCE